VIYAVFCRSYHPRGYGGFSDNVKMPNETYDEFRQRVDRKWAISHRDPPYFDAAHGYVTLVVTCANTPQLERVTERLQRYWQWPDRGDTWYSGTFDRVWAVNALSLDDENRAMSKDMRGLHTFLPGEYRSYGDNRACAYLTYEQVMAQDRTSEGAQS
jgi:hypothetical protein